MMNELMNDNNLIYFLGYKKGVNCIYLLFDIYTKNSLSYRLYYRIKKSPFVEVYGRLAMKEQLDIPCIDIYDLDDICNKRTFIDITDLSLNTIEYYIESVYCNKDDIAGNCFYSIIANTNNSFSPIPAFISEKLYFYISFIVYFFEKDLCHFDNYKKYSDFINNMDINIINSHKVNTLSYYPVINIVEKTKFETRYYHDSIETSDDITEQKYNIELDQIIYEERYGKDNFRLVRLEKSNLPDNLKDFKIDSCNYSYPIIHTHKRKIYIPQEEWDIFTLLDKPKIAFVHRRENDQIIQFVFPVTVK